MSKELENIILTIDTREQNQRRIKAVEDYFTGHGAIVEHSALKHCDYRLIGEFRGQSVNLSVEAKGWDNFLSDDIAEMEEKLLLATAEYDHVGFFVETQNYTFTPDENNQHGKLNYSIPKLNKNLPAKTLATFEGFLDTISKHPQIHVRQLRGEGQFPYSLYDLLVYLQNEHGLTRNGYLNKNIFLAWYKSLLAAIPSLKSESTRNGTMTKKRIEKVIEHYPNLFWLCSASEESLMQVMGKQIGMTIYTVLHYDELITPEWKAGHHQDGTVKYKTICGQDCYNPQHCNALCERHPNNPKFNTGSKVQDDEGRPAFDAPAKNPVKPVCDFADPKKHAECKTPNHFKHSKIPSHAEGTILSNHNHPLPSADTFPSHPDRTHSRIDSIPQQRSGDIPQPPITETTAVKQEGLSVSFFPPAEINIGLNDKPLDCVVKCRACHQVIIPEQDDESGFCHDPDCIKIRKEPSLENKLRIFLRKPHTVEEIVEEYGCSAGYTYQVCTANVKTGNIKKVTEQDGRVTFQRIIC